MAELIAPLPRTTLSPGMTIRLEAIDPTTGNAVTGVKVSSLAIYAVTADTGEPAELTVTLAEPDVAPLWAPTPTAIP